MVQKYVSEPSEKMDGSYNVSRFDEVKQTYVPLETYQSESLAKEQAKSLNREYAIEEFQKEIVSDLKDRYCFVDNSSDAIHFFILLNITKKWDDVILIEFRNSEAINVVRGRDCDKRGYLYSFFIEASYGEKYRERNLEMFLPISFQQIDKIVEQIIQEG